MSPVYACIVCDREFHSLSASRFPDFYCSRCYADWSKHEKEKWLKYLIRTEVCKRVRRYRLKKQGIKITEVSLDELRGL